MDKPIKYRDLLKIVGRYGIYEDKRRAKGSERLWIKALTLQKNKNDKAKR